MEKKTMRRRWIIRLALAAVWIGLGVLLFLFNRGHTLLVDNKNLEDMNIKAPDLIKVTVNKGKSLEFFRGDRDLFKVKGSRHRISIEYSDGTEPFEKEITLSLLPDMYLLSIPKMINNIEPFIEVFHIQTEPQSDEEAVIAE